MKIAFHRYRLWFRANYGSVGPANFREGALLRITFDDGLIGYADCHPWVELGDLPLAKQLDILQSRNKTPLLECSCHFARLDAEARKAGLSVFEGLAIPPSHQLLALEDDIAMFIAQGLTHFKLKCGKFPENELSSMLAWMNFHPNMHLRLDFNERLRREAFLKYWQSLPLNLRDAIDFIEDPYPYDTNQWTHDQQRLGVSFAADAQAMHAQHFPDSARVIILKPAVNGLPQNIAAETQIVVTTYLDHPLGQMCAAFVAAKLKMRYPAQVGVCGLLSHKYYHADAFIAAVHAQGPLLSPPGGTGFGFDASLKALPWHTL